MSKLTKQNVGGTDYTMVGCTLTGVCASAAADFIKIVALSDGDVLSDGMTVVCTFANGNTAGNAPGEQTIYSSDQVNYYEDEQLTVPFTLAPSGCYTLEYTGTGNAYTYQSFPVIQVGSVLGPLCTANGSFAGGAVWADGSCVQLLYSSGKFLALPVIASSLFCTANSAVVIGPTLFVGGSIKVMFTNNITASDTTAPFVINYNGADITVKVPRNGSLIDYKASAVNNINYYCQAYTTLELAFDGSNFIILGNSVIYSNTDITIYTDGLKRVNSVSENDKNMVTSEAVYNTMKSLPFENFIELKTEDLNDIIENGLYYTNNIDTLLNKPTGDNMYNLFIFVYRNPKAMRVLQLLYTLNLEKLYIRRFQSEWSTWKEL